MASAGRGAPGAAHQARRTAPPLGGGEVHLWRLDAARPDAGVDAPADCLDAAERARAVALIRAEDQRRFARFRGALRTILGAYLGEDPARLGFEVGRWGKPRLAAPWRADGIEFSLSHHGDRGVLAVARRRPVGVDVEIMPPPPASARLAARVFAACERAEWLGLPVSERPAAFLRGWTRKEAYLKATGEGLARQPETVRVTLSPGAARLRAVEGRPGEAARWRLRDLAPWPDAVAALCAPVGSARPVWVGGDDPCPS